MAVKKVIEGVLCPNCKLCKITAVIEEADGRLKLSGYLCQECKVSYPVSFEVDYKDKTTKIYGINGGNKFFIRSFPSDSLADDLKKLYASNN